MDSCFSHALALTSASEMRHTVLCADKSIVDHVRVRCHAFPRVVFGDNAVTRDAMHAAQPRHDVHSQRSNDQDTDRQTIENDAMHCQKNQMVASRNAFDVPSRPVKNESNAKRHDRPREKRQKKKKIEKKCGVRMAASHDGVTKKPKP